MALVVVDLAILEKGSCDIDAGLGMEKQETGDTKSPIKATQPRRKSSFVFLKLNAYPGTDDDVLFFNSVQDMITLRLSQNGMN